MATLKSLVSPDAYRPDLYAPPGVMEAVRAAAAALPRRSLIALHGWMGSGKSASAMWLGRELALPEQQVIHLDDIRRDANATKADADAGFDEAKMRIAIDDAVSRDTVIVEGVCAGRVCEPDILVLLGDWPFPNDRTSEPTKRMRRFIADYDPEAFGGRVKTFEARWTGEDPF